MSGARQKKLRIVPLVGEVYEENGRKWVVDRVLQKSGAVALRPQGNPSLVQGISAERWAELVKSGTMLRLESKTHVGA